MKKFLTCFALVAAIGFANLFAGDVYYEESFSTLDLGSWTTVDQDGNIVAADAISTLANMKISLFEKKLGWAVGQISSSPINYAAISTSWYNPVSTSDDWLISPEIEIGEDAYLEWSAAAFSSSYADGYKVYISTTGANVEDFKTEIFSIAAEPNGTFNRRAVDLAKLGYKNQKIRIAFQNNSTDKYFLAIDDIKVWKPNQFDLALAMIDFGAYSKGGSPIKVPVYIQNLGVGTISSFDLNYQFDGEEVVTATINNPSIAYYAYGKVEHPTAWTPSVIGARTVKVWISNINGEDLDAVKTNNELEKSTFVWDATNSIEIFPLFEEFTSATCAPCASVNKTLNPLLKSNKEKMAIVKYQMNWPGNGDIYYTAEGGTRRTYYGVSGVPQAFANGEGYSFSTTNLSQTGINNTINQPGFFEIINPTYNVNDKTVTVDFAVKSINDLTGQNIVAHVAVIENTTSKNKSSNGETEFYNVMKKMMPGATGSKITALGKGETKTFNLTYTFPTDNTVEEFDDLSVVLWVQNVDTKRVLEAAYAVKSAVSVPLANDGSGIVAVFPNPSSEVAMMRYSVVGEKEVTIGVYSLDGKLVSEINRGILSEGYYVEDFKLDNLSNGSYIVKLAIGDRVFTDKINVVK